MSGKYDGITDCGCLCHGMPGSRRSRSTATTAASTLVAAVVL